MDHVVVVGASLAGLRACETLRAEGYTGIVTLIGAERHMPYDRPPLSKKLLAGEWEADRIELRRPDAYPELNIVFKLGAAATSLDLAARRVHLADGASVPFDGLVIATGATPKRLPEQPDLLDVHMLRSLDDSLDLRNALGGRATPPRVVVIGAGFIGLEVAATARSAYGCDVTVLEGLPAPLVRGLGAEMGIAVAAVHADHGVELRCGVAVQAIEGDGRKVTGVRLGDGSLVEADVVVVGIGVAPATEWLQGSGLELRDGIVCDETLCAGAPGVYAAGDIARWTHRLFGEEMRVEHWTTAAEQGAAAAANLVRWSRGDDTVPYDAVPFFWSDQYDARVQFLGRAGGDDEVRIVHGSPDERRFVALYGSAGRLRAALGVTLPKLLMPFRKLLAEGISYADALGFAATQPPPPPPR